MLQTKNLSNFLQLKRTMATDSFLVALCEAHRFIKDCLLVAGAAENHAIAMADLLVAADERGHYSHGLNRLEMYVNEVKNGSCDGKATPVIINENESCAWVHGKNALGVVVGNFSMDLAIRKAKKQGVGLVSAKGSNHYGIAALYPQKASEEGLIGFTCSNTSPFLCPTRAKTASLGTNPLSLSAPGTKDDDCVLLDMATTAVAVGKIELAKRKGTQIPEGWGMDENAKDTTDPHKVKLLHPIGGSELHSGFKGYGLALTVEILCGILSGSHYGHKIRQWGVTNKPADLGQFFLAINPEFFVPDFQSRMSDLIHHLRRLPPAEDGKPVLVPGDPERLSKKRAHADGGLKYSKNQMETCERLSKTLGVEMLKILEK